MEEGWGSLSGPPRESMSGPEKAEEMEQELVRQREIEWGVLLGDQKAPVWEERMENMLDEEKAGELVPLREVEKAHGLVEKMVSRWVHAKEQKREALMEASWGE